MDEPRVRVERTPTWRRALWPPLRRRQDVEITLPLRTVEDLFATPSLDPFEPGYERYGDKSGIDTLADVLHVERPVSRIRATIELPRDAFEPSLGHRTNDAVRRHCRVKIGDLDQDLRQIRRYGTWALAIGALAVLVLNGIANPLDSTNNDLLQLISQGLQIAAWVTLWFPINLLVYDRWYARRDQAIYREMLRMELALVPDRRDEGPGEGV
jgi:hypothetical protein